MEKKENSSTQKWLGEEKYEVNGKIFIVFLGREVYGDPKKEPHNVYDIYDTSHNTKGFGNHNRCGYLKIPESKNGKAAVMARIREFAEVTADTETNKKIRLRKVTNKPLKQESEK